jgi:hypothetical protein
MEAHRSSMLGLAPAVLPTGQQRLLPCPTCSEHVRLSSGGMSRQASPSGAGARSRVALMATTTPVALPGAAVTGSTTATAGGLMVSRGSPTCGRGEGEQQGQWVIV